MRWVVVCACNLVVVHVEQTTLHPLASEVGLNNYARLLDYFSLRTHAHISALFSLLDLRLPPPSFKANGLLLICMHFVATSCAHPPHLLLPDCRGGGTVGFMDPFELCHGRWEVESTDVYGVIHTIIDLLTSQRYTPCFAAWTQHERDLFLQIAQWCCERPADRPRMSTLLIVLQQFMASGGVSADMAARLPMYHNRAQLSVRLVQVNSEFG